MCGPIVTNSRMDHAAPAELRPPCLRPLIPLPSQHLGLGLERLSVRLSSGSGSRPSPVELRDHRAMARSLHTAAVFPACSSLSHPHRNPPRKNHHHGQAKKIGCMMQLTAQLPGPYKASGHCQRRGDALLALKYRSPALCFFVPGSACSNCTSIEPGSTAVASHADL